jgi:hypothetical protein
VLLSWLQIMVVRPGSDSMPNLSVALRGKWPATQTVIPPDVITPGENALIRLSARSEQPAGARSRYCLALATSAAYRHLDRND